MTVEEMQGKITRLSSVDEGASGQKVRMAGWIQDIRNLGGIAFIIMREREGVFQVTSIRKKDPELFEGIVSVPRESVLIVDGTVQKNEEVINGFELIAESFQLVSEAQTPLPLGVIDKVGADLDTRLNNRFLDLRKEEILSLFRLRNIVEGAMRNFFEKNDFIEVHTPKIVAAGAEGGATLFPLNYFDSEAYLAQSPQLYKQMLMGAGFDRVYEIAPAYRAEASDTVRHIAEFISVDAEMSFIESSEDVMSLCERLVYHTLEETKRDGKDHLERWGVDISLPKLPFRRVGHDECISYLTEMGKGVDPEGGMDTEGEKLIGQWIDEKHKEQFYFITNFPTSVVGKTFYAKRDDDSPDITEYFDLACGGLEIVSGGQREHRYDILVKQIEENNLDPKEFDFYLKAFKYGMPPHGGFGLGVERLLQRIMGIRNIRECVLFPRDRARLVP
ncbi:MAG: aspartate--tRNA(Asn) ligase [Thermoplasmata archaeon]